MSSNEEVPSWLASPHPRGVTHFDTKMVTCEFCLRFCPIAKSLHWWYL